MHLKLNAENDLEHASGEIARAPRRALGIFWVIALTLAFTTGLYTSLGGMRLIMYTDALQTPVLIVGSLCVLYAGLQALGHGSLIAGSV